MPPTTDAIGVNSTTPEWSPRVLYANHSYNTGAEAHIVVPSQDDMINFSTDEAKAKPNHREITIQILNHDYTATEPR
jgi:hypothetical protein